MRARVVGLVASVAAMLAGCNGILGFGDFVKVDCVDDCGIGQFGDADADASVAPDADAGTADVREADAPPPFEAGPDVEDVPLARKWARWPMPTAESSPDGAPPYEIDGGDTIVDPATKLTWSALTFETSSYEDALEHCKTLGGTVPTRIELATLIDTTHANPAWNPAFGKPDAQAPLVFWTASQLDGGPHWTIDFAFGVVKTGPGRVVRCVRLP